MARLYEWHFNAIGFASIGSLPLQHPVTRRDDYRHRLTVEDKATFDILKPLSSTKMQLQELIFRQLQMFSPEKTKKLVLLVKRAIRRNSIFFEKDTFGSESSEFPSYGEHKPSLNCGLSCFHRRIRSGMWRFRNLHPLRSEMPSSQILKILHEDTEPSKPTAVEELKLSLLNVLPAQKFESCPLLF